MWATAIVYGSGLALLMIVLACMRQAFPGGRVASVPWWAWTGGVISLGSTIAGLTMTQKLGSGLFTAASLTTGIVVSVLLDNFGVLGLKHHPASPARWVGCALLIGGVWLVAKF